MNKTAKLYCITPPDERQLKGLGDFLERTFGTRPKIEIIKDASVVGGFRLEYDGNIYDWSARNWIGKFKAAEEARGDGSSAKLYCVTPPDESQLKGICDFLERTFGTRPQLEVIKDPSIIGGFRLEYGGNVYDWSAKSRIERFKEQVKNSGKGTTTLLREAVDNLKRTISDWNMPATSREVGKVLSVGDGIAKISGLDTAEYGEIVVFECGLKGMVQELSPEGVGCILFGEDREVESGTAVYRTGKTAGVPAGEGLIGRIVDALGSPLDGGSAITAEAYMPIETPAPSIIDRQPVNTPLRTGILSIDSMFPIGRGQRELIIGDRQTGKTALAIDTILNQKGQNVICIYVAIGQKASSVARLAENLKKRGAMDYTIIVSATAGDPASLQYIAPYSGCAIGEYFMNSGRDVLIVYDDLSKHAVAYRALSLLLGRSPGREAYPGDVFYLHSRLLERAAHLSDERGGGSMTALPVVETQAGDISAYIPTNIISITDGQIFLSGDLFYSGQRPAVNVGISVSRVGGDAQTKAMKTAAGTIRLNLAQYREMEVFMQFSSDLDENTQRTLDYGRGLMMLLRQPQYSPLAEYRQVILLVAATGHAFSAISPDEIPSVKLAMLEHFDDAYPEIVEEIKKGGAVTAELKSAIINAAKDYVATYAATKAQNGANN
ncbi:MAG TPA: F0F1 ATP synthase subunit alpha [Candidatus Coproplasma avicola]|uniref:ATP synthase subunit alpha n=1 Tax=Candidatus Coproplasma avicola TaxID=2840744 RepID=A0A9D1E5L0_9FIRM|nr:F0F1 ATP synthase subunit alpha [Candidatus Coproplasma avicola]